MSILWLRQNKNHHNYYMSLFMKGEAKKHFVAGCRKRYGEKRSRKAKSDIIDDLMLYVGYKSRKHVIRVLNHAPEKRKRKPRGRHKILTPPMLELLREIWAMQGYPCSKLLKASLPDWLGAWKNRNTIPLDDERLKLVDVSASTLERALAPYRMADASLTKEAREQSLTQLKQSIPYVDRSRRPEKPGALSIDTVAHCQGDLSGSFVWTLTLTDELTHWTQNRAIWNKGQYVTCNALRYLFRRLPFRVRSLNTDNGSEFINHHVQRFLSDCYRTCKVTRSRPHKKNDNARVEERNRRVVREHFGDVRFDDEGFVRLLNRFYRYSNRILNHFSPCMHLVSKRRQGTRIIKQYDEAKTPYQRVMEHLPEGRRKERLKALHESLDPIDLASKVQQCRRAILHLLRQSQEIESE